LEAIEVELASIFTDFMVLQRDKKIPVWGTALDGKDVVVTFNGQTKKTKVKDSKWQIELDSMETVNIGTELIAQCDKTVITLKNILVGEVWIASGQSNMGMYTQYLLSPFHELVTKDCDIDGIRVFTQPENESEIKESRIPNGKWNLCNESTVKLFSTVGFFFARQLHKALNVPVGIVVASVGGSRIEKFIDNDLLSASKYPIFQNEDYKKNTYNAMVSPLKPFRVRGLIWYQGEANGCPTDMSFIYSEYLTLLTKNYAQDFGGDEYKTFPVLVVQLPIYSGIDAEYKEIRLQQMLASKQDNRIFTTVNIDSGSLKDIHPSDKDLISLKLTNMALAKVYNIDASHKYPLADSAVIENGNIIIKFKNVDQGIEIKEGDIKYLVVYDKDDMEYPATAQVVGKDTISVESKSKTPIGVSYGYQSSLPGVNFFDKNNLPVAPFKIIIGL
jgi:sialate O-acetylesterase